MAINSLENDQRLDATGGPLRPTAMNTWFRSAVVDRGTSRRNSTCRPAAHRAPWVWFREAARLCAGLVCAGACVLAAAAENPGTDRTMSPYFFVKSADAGDDGPGGQTVDVLPLKGTNVQAVIAGSFAEVKVTQRYVNSGAIPLEAQYIFPGSTRAAVHGLTMTIGNRRLEAKTKERAEARRTYEAAKSAGKTASLLEQHRPNVFQMNVANILPGDEITVELRYTEMLVPTDGVYEFVYPGVVGPRYSNAPAGPGTPPSVAWVENPYLRKGEDDPAAFALSVEVLAGVPLQDVLCRTHSTHVAYRGAAEASIEVRDTNGSNRDFVLNYRVSGGAIQSGLLLAEGAGENFFLLTVQPPVRPVAAEMPPREFVFVVDVSGSMNGFPLNISKKLMMDLLVGLRPQDTFNVLLFAGGSEVFAPHSVAATPENVARALRLLEQQQGGGATEVIPALKMALAMRQAENVSRTFVVITDGYIAVEAEAFRLIRENLGRANLFAFGIGSAVNRHLVEGLARAGQGEPFIVTDPDAAPAAALKFQQYISTPVLTRVKLRFEGFETYDVEPASVPDLMAQRPLVVFGKWRGPKGGRIVVEGLTGASLYRSSHDVAEAVNLPGADGLARLWARTRIAQLGDEAELPGAGDMKAAITNLGLTYNLLTRYTSFVAVDEGVRRTTPTLKTVKQPLPLPAGVENSAVGGTGVSAAPEPGIMALAGVGALVLMVALRKRRAREGKP